MRAVIAEAPGKVTVVEVPDPALPGSRAAIVKIEKSAICGSDLHFYDGDLPLFPVALGHEGIGTVLEVGGGVRTIRVGDRVLIASVAGCGTCAGCATGDPVACVNGAKVFGSGELGGTQSELLAVPAADFQLLRIPRGIDDEAALLLTDNLAIGWAGAKRGDIAGGDTVVVFGLGAVGQCAVRSALTLGAGRVFGYDPVSGRVDRAVAAGATALRGPPVESVLELTGGRGADVVIDAVASDTTLDASFAAVRSTGTVSVIGIHDLSPYPLGVLMGVFRSITLRMTTAPVQATWTDLVPMVQSGQLDTTGIFARTFTFAEASDAYAAVASRTADCLKVVLIP